MKAKVLIAVGILSGMILMGLTEHGYTQTSFFKGKTIALVRGGGTGGTGDMRARAIIPFLTKYIPGNPNVLLKYRPGSGGRLAGNYIYSSARPDGLTIGSTGGGLVSNGFLGARGVRYDIDKFHYLGTGNSKTNYVLAVNSKTGLDTLEKFQSASGLRLGALSIGHDLYINLRLFAWLMELKEPRFVTGYSGGPEMDLALIKGEVDVRTNIPATILQRSPEWIDDKLVYFHSIVEIPRGYRPSHPAFARLPSLQSFVKTDRERKVLEMYRIFRLVGSPYFLAPDTPPDRVKTLREAFSKTYRDPEFHQLFKKYTGDEATPLFPEEQEQAIKNIPRDPETVKLFKQIAGAGPLPPR